MHCLIPTTEHPEKAKTTVTVDRSDATDGGEEGGMRSWSTGAEGQQSSSGWFSNGREMSPCICQNL